MKINILMGPFYPMPPTRGLAVERRQFAMATQYAKRGHSVTIISRAFENRAEDEVVDGVRFIRVRSSDEPGNKIAYRFSDIAYNLRVRKIIPRADVTVTNSVSAPFFVPRRAGIVHVSVGRYPKGQMGLYQRAGRLLAPSRAIAAAIMRQSPRMTERVKVIPNPMGEPFADAARTLIAAGKSPARNQEIVYLGRVAREKGLHILINAFALIAPKYPGWRLSIIGPSGASGGGDGDAYAKELKLLAAPLGDRISFDGPIYEPSHLIRRLQAAGLFVYPSIAERGEAFGVAPIEAMACGCPIILSSLECFDEFLVPGENGLKFDHRVSAAENLADKCDEMLASLEDRDRIGFQALISSQKFFPDRISDLMLDDFDQLVSRP